MANMQVTDVTSTMFTEVTNLTAGIENSKKTVNEAGDFSKVFEDASKKNAGLEPDKTNDKNVEQVGPIKGNSNSNKVKAEETVSKDPINNSEDRTEAAKEIVDKATNVKDKIKESFDISDEELTAVMENMGISLQDLLNPDMLKDLVTELTGVTDSISLITNADLYASVKSVMEAQAQGMEELVNEFAVETSDIISITEDDNLFSNLISQMELVTSSDEELVEEIELPQDFNEAVDDFSNTVQISITNEVTDTFTTDVLDRTIENVAKDVEPVEAVQASEVVETVEVKQESDVPAKKIVDDNVKVEESQVDEKVTEDGEKLSKMPTAEEQSGKGRNEGFEGGNRFGREQRQKIDIINESTSNTQTVSTTSVNNVGDIIETITSYSTRDANEIVSQVTESIKVNLSNDSSSLEMMLHPASLGTVNMQVSSTNGVVTAHILVENEAVRAALESQLITLQDSFEAAGHKVEAVEVSVANYDLNKGMNQEQNRNQGSKDHENAFRVMGSRRRINLNLLNEEDDVELNDEEKIAKDMMERNGNTVDYTV